MHTSLKSWLIVGLLLATAAYCVAEELTLTTYYPSPRGVYQELRSTSNSYFGYGTNGADGTLGRVGIGTETVPANERLHVKGNLVVEQIDPISATDDSGQLRLPNRDSDPSDLGTLGEGTLYYRTDGTPRIFKNNAWGNLGGGGGGGLIATAGVPEGGFLASCAEQGPYDCYLAGTYKTIYTLPIYIPSGISNLRGKIRFRLNLIGGGFYPVGVRFKIGGSTSPDAQTTSVTFVDSPEVTLTAPATGWQTLEIQGAVGNTGGQEYVEVMRFVLYPQ